MQEVPVYVCIEIVEKEKGTALIPQQYRRAADHLWKEKKTVIYLFNFFITREGSTKPGFQVLSRWKDTGVVK